MVRPDSPHTSLALAGFTWSLKFFKKSIPITGKATAAFKKRQLNWRPLTLIQSWVSTQHDIEVPEGLLRREPETGREE
jgi:hypothetical protein